MEIFEESYKDFVPKSKLDEVSGQSKEYKKIIVGDPEKLSVYFKGK